MEAARLGFWAAIAAFAVSAGYVVSQLLQIAGLLPFPWDDIGIYGFSMFIPLAVIAALAALYHEVPEPRRVWVHVGLALAVLYGALVTVVYPTQLAVVIPARLTGEGTAIQHLTLATGGFLWAVDGAGYIVLGLATLFTAGAFAGDPDAAWLRRFLIANGLVSLVVAAIMAVPALFPFGALWIVTAPGSFLLLARYFRRRLP